MDCRASGVKRRSPQITVATSVAAGLSAAAATTASTSIIRSAPTRVAYISPGLPSAHRRVSVGKAATPVARPKTPMGTFIRVRAYWSWAMAPSPRSEA